MTMREGYPRVLPMSARPMPVFPAVPSTMSPPGFRVFCFSALRIMASAALSLTDPPGLRNSAFPRM